jgi:hypothetical protein
MTPVANYERNLPIFEEANLAITGVTRDNAGNPLANCNVYLFDAAFGPQVLPGVGSGTTYEMATVSDGSGNFSFAGLSRMSGKYFVLAWSSDGLTAGVTLTNLAPA